MEFRTISRSEWTRILEREYVLRPFSSGDYEGFESLIVMKEVREPLAVKNGDEYVTIVKEGYSWLQIAAKDQLVWMTAMFDEQDNFFQLYFDITAGNILDDGEPHFRDMYLDIILTPACQICVLDEDELDGALSCGDITKEEYDAAKSTCSRLESWLKLHAKEIIEYCRQRQKLLKP